MHTSGMTGHRVIALISLMLLPMFTAPAMGRTLFVRAGAPAGGSGSMEEPFNSLAAIEEASTPGDEIIVLPAPLDVPPLDGGIALKPGQKLSGHAKAGQMARIGNGDVTRHSGDAVVLADGVEVSHLAIVNSRRGGIYGSNVNDVRIHDNELTGNNGSCEPGFYVYFPGNKPLLANGWAAIMVDVDRGSSLLSIENNHIHDETCSDGIDIRATGNAEVSARISFNTITRLAQGPRVRSVLAIGLQTRDSAVLTVDSAYNSETYIGSAHADCEGLFTNQTGGFLTWNVDHNTFAHGIGGRSCNGAEFYTVFGDSVASGATTTNLYISHSSFEDNPGDMIEEDNNGAAGSIMNLTLEDVTIRHATLEKALPPEPRFIDAQFMDNLGRCVDQFSWGHQTTNNLRIINSRISDCAGDGIGADVNGGIYRTGFGGKRGGMDLGDGAGNSLSIDIENSIVDGSSQYALHFSNHVAMDTLSIRVANSRLANATGPAVAAFDQDGTTRHAEIDLGSEGAGSAGQNCIEGGSGLLAEVSGYEVNARHNWWGRKQGPAASEISVTNGHLYIEPVLGARPESCAGNGARGLAERY